MTTTTLDIPARYAQPRRIGRGGMGEILLVRDTQLARDVVLKLLRADCEPAITARFRREALAAARLSGHPHVVTVFDVGEHDGCPYIVMEYLPGGTLAGRVRAGDVPIETRMRWIAETAEALDAAHAAGIVHRDIKPGNLLLDERARVRVADFGIARAAHAAAATQTAPGTVLGTAGYLSPEQASGETVGPASDRYSLAVVAWELLAGRRPFERESFAAEAAAHVHEPVPPLDGFGPAVDAVFARALAKHPADRHQTARAFASELQRALDDGADTHVAPTVVAVTPPRSSANGPRWYEAAGRRRRLVAAAALLLLVLAAIVAAADDAPAPEQTTARTNPSAPAPEADETTTEEAIALHEQAWELIQDGRFAEALPIAREALANLRGVAPYEAYASYNVGFALLRLGRCGDALPLLERSEQLQGARAEIDAARSEAVACLEGDEQPRGDKPAKGRGKGRDKD